MKGISILAVWYTVIVLWLSAASEQSTVSLLCIHLLWPHFLSTLQASQYFIRVLREMYNIYYLAVWVNVPYKNSNPSSSFPHSSFLRQIKFSFMILCLFHVYGFWFTYSENAIWFKKSDLHQLSLAKCLYLHWILVTKGIVHKRWHGDERAGSKMTSNEFLQIFPHSNPRVCVHTHSEDALYRSFAYLLAEHHTAQTPHNVPEASVFGSSSFRQKPELPPAAACFLEHIPPAETTQYPQCTMGVPLVRPASKRTCSVKMTWPYVNTLHFSFSHSGEILHHFICVVTEGFCHFACGAHVCLHDSQHFDTLST